jgi:hypothetical protein
MTWMLGHMTMLGAIAGAMFIGPFMRRQNKQNAEYIKVQAAERARMQAILVVQKAQKQARKSEKKQKVVC